VGRKWIIGAAWPYTNTIPHLGNMIGSVLSADVYARYLRLVGDEVVFVSGSDEHGTPIEVEALQLGVDPKYYADRMHEIVAKLFSLWEISFDNYTRTESEIHKEFVRSMFMRIYENGFVFVKEEELPYCPKDGIFLPDRFIVGKCPYCGYDRARGDQCEQCGRLLEPRQLIEARCAVCGSVPEWRKSKHWYFDLPKLEGELRKYVEGNENLPPNAKTMSLALLREGLQPRAITRDNKWGIPAPFPGAEGKTIYVWFDAVLGYISATIEYFSMLKKEEKWREFWTDPETRVVFFIGKDNIPFHTIIFPALLIASGCGFVLPYTVASTEYLMYEGGKFSKSKRWGLWIDEAIQLLPADYWRFILVYNRPETRDTNFSWSYAVDVVNKVLNDDVGNYVHRVLTFIWSRFKGEVPGRGAVEEVDLEFEERVRSIIEEVRMHYERIELKDALHKTVEIARLGNRYLNERAPWDLIKHSPDRAGAVLNVAAWSVKALAVLLYPVIPRSSEELWIMLGFDPPVGPWSEVYKPIEERHRIREPRPLFRKISEDDLRNMLERLEDIRRVKHSGKYPWEQAIIPT